MEFPEYCVPCPQGVMERTFQVTKDQTDIYGRMCISDLARQMEKITEAHLSSYGLNAASLQEEGKAWVISWTSIYIAELPEEEDKVILRIWPGKKKAVMYTRQYGFYTEDGKPLVSAASLFLLMDLKTRSVAAPTEKLKEIPCVKIPGEAKLPAMSETMPETFEKQVMRSVQSTEIDKNGHMNNTCYLDWAEDLRMKEGYGDGMPSYIWVQYNKELQEGETAKLQYTIDKDTFFLQGVSDAGDAFRVLMKIRAGERMERGKKMSFIDSIFQKAKANKQTIAIPEYKNEYMIKAAAKANADGIANILLVGDTAEIKESAKSFGLDITGVKIADINDETYKADLLERYDAMKEKVMPRKFIEKRIKDPLYLATLIEAVGDADGTLAGVDTTTYEFVLAANSIIGMDPGCPTASGLLIMEIDGFEGKQGKIIGCSDGAVCIEPTIEQHASIAIASCQTFEAVTGVEARCAFLSYSTDGSGGSSEPVKKVRAAVELAQKTRPDLKIDGEFQADAAIDARVGAKKVKRPSEVAGRANVLIFPDAAGCNIGTKLVQRLGGATVFGPLYQGFRKPILDCSRSDTDDILYNDIALLSVLSAAKK